MAPGTTVQVWVWYTERRCVRLRMISWEAGGNASAWVGGERWEIRAMGCVKPWALAVPACQACDVLVGSSREHWNMAVSTYLIDDPL